MIDRPNVFRIDLGAVAACTREIRALIGPSCHFIATLKADGYGYGVLPVARTVLVHGADALSMSSVRDAVALREAGINVPILVYAGALHDARSVALHEKYTLTPSLHNEASFNAFAEHLKSRIRVAVKVDVGPERIGVPLSSAYNFVRRVHEHPQMELFAVHAHPNVRGGDGERECMQWQYDRFVQLRAELEAGGITGAWFSLASSKVLRMAGASMALNAVDPGASLFSSLSGRPAQAFAQLRTNLVAVRTVERSEHLDQAPFAMHPGMRIGVLPIGLADGVHHVHAGSVLVGGRRAPMVGKPALEYTRIDLSALPNAKVGDDVVIIGSQEEAEITPEEACVFQGASRVIDLALHIGPAVQREYLGP